jgi:hypothetical protein
MRPRRDGALVGDLSGFFLGAVVGALFGVIATVILQPTVDRHYHALLTALRRRTRSAAPLQTDLQDIGLVQLARWTATRPLDPERHSVDLDHSPPTVYQQWFPTSAWEREKARDAESYAGEVCQVTDYSIDHGEAGEESKSFRLKVRPSTYPGGVTVQRLCQQDEYWQPVLQHFRERGGRDTLRVAPDQHFFTALTVTTARGETLAVRRSSSTVATAMGLWSLAACETMAAIPGRPGERPEDLFDLARRAAREEFGLSRQDIGHIWYSWFGFSSTDGLMAVAHTQTTLECADVASRVLDAEGGYESDALRWIRVNSAEHKLLSRRAANPGWVAFTPIVAEGLGRMWGTLSRPPIRR